MSCAGAPVPGTPGHFLPPSRRPASGRLRGPPVPVVSRADFSGSGFSQAHQKGGRESSWVVPSSLPPLVERPAGAGARPLSTPTTRGSTRSLTSAGSAELYDAELRFVDRLVADIMAASAPGGGAGRYRRPRPGRMWGPEPDRWPPRWPASASLSAAKPRFRWLHGRPGRGAALLGLRPAALRGRGLGGQPGRSGGAGSARGGPVPLNSWARLGDVALVPLGDDAYLDPGDAGRRQAGLPPRGPHRADEMFVPLLAVPASAAQAALRARSALGLVAA